MDDADRRHERPETAEHQFAHYRVLYVSWRPRMQGGADRLSVSAAPLRARAGNLSRM